MVYNIVGGVKMKMNKHTRKELIKLVDQYNLTVFERARILYRAKIDFSYYKPFIKNIYPTLSDKEIDYSVDLKGFFNQVKKDCLEVVVK